jgi:uncharacterized protein YsxB (DUF464 family)
MTKVTVYVDSLHKPNDDNLTNLNYEAIKVEGHTRKDVCAAISALAWTLAGALVNMSEHAAVEEEEGYMLISLGQEASVSTNLIFETIVVGLEQIIKKHKDLVHPIETLIKDREVEVL